MNAAHSAFPPLPPNVAALAQRAQRAIERAAWNEAVAPLNEALQAQPGHPALLQLSAVLERGRGNVANAVALFGHLHRQFPHDAALANHLGAALAEAGQSEAAIAAFRHALDLDSNSIGAAYNLGRALDLRGEAAAALAAFDQALRVDPRHRPSRILRAECLKQLGRLREAEDALRAVLREAPDTVAAWVGLANLRALAPGDLDAVARLYADPHLHEAQRIDLGFVYGTMLEDAGRYAEAFATLQAANAAKRRRVRWNAAAVSALIDDILAAFAPSHETEEEHDEADRGAGAIFLVGMPRSGSTLAEQILAAHPEVASGGEREDVARILQEESRRRGRRFPTWVGEANAADWRRLGEEYLRRCATWHGGRAHFTDKTLTNWQTLGAIRRMLPGARIVHCVRDPLETAWSCYKHHFGEAQFFAYDFADLGAFSRDCARAMRTWDARHPGWIHTHAHEALLAQPEARTSALLDACGLDFDAACLNFHEVRREVHTASAAQVRRPLQRGVALAERYGTLLDPLRRALGVTA
ncbi:tetratricopeptide repeat-containing sulfotransferase family protein [Dokdonella sp.]|uniref:tetratricopeptide repeat-containing sulfotransferase family protein n=1 Tax=Dokdonella sp. TaxID=2291710 RepID=UPI001B1B3AAF|nr:tetratricopeptide repeat-containing sulfotransferase family protein [Dokdonella sp.]MBO9661467.1 sulfotransferase [Dokdonella sp.]